VRREVAKGEEKRGGGAEKGNCPYMRFQLVADRSISPGLRKRKRRKGGGEKKNKNLLPPHGPRQIVGKKRWKKKKKKKERKAHYHRKENETPLAQRGRKGKGAGIWPGEIFQSPNRSPRKEKKRKKKKKKKRIR